MVYALERIATIYTHALEEIKLICQVLQVIANSVKEMFMKCA